MINHEDYPMTREQALEIENNWLRHNLWMLTHTVKIQGEAFQSGKISAEHGLNNSLKITVAISDRVGSI